MPDKDKKPKRKYKKMPVVLTDVKYINNPDTAINAFDTEIRAKFPDLIGWDWQCEKKELTLDFGEAENPIIDFAAIGTVKEVI